MIPVHAMFVLYQSNSVNEFQQGDPDLNRSIEYLEGEDPLELVKRLEGGFNMNNGIIPSSCREELLCQHHDMATGGYHGVERVIRQFI